MRGSGASESRLENTDTRRVETRLDASLVSARLIYRGEGAERPVRKESMPNFRTNGNARTVHSQRSAVALTEVALLIPRNASALALAGSSIYTGRHRCAECGLD